MASGGVVLGFLVMLVLPCATTLFGGQEEDAEGVDADAAAVMEPDQGHATSRLRPRVTVQYEAEYPQTALLPARAETTKVPAPVTARQSFPEDEPRVPLQSNRRPEKWHETTAPIPATRTKHPRLDSPVWVDDVPTPTHAREQSREDWQGYGEAMNRAPRTQRSRLDLAELDVLRARAVAVRAHADALAAVARAARAKAEAAAEKAAEAEQKAWDMSQYLRRAA